MTDTTTLHARRVVSIRPISRVGHQRFDSDRRATLGSVYANWLYINRLAGQDERGRLDFTHRRDLVASSLALPANQPAWARDGGRIWREVDEATVGLAADAVRAWHVAVTLAPDATVGAWEQAVQTYADGIAARGPAVCWAIHAEAGDGGRWATPPHAHLLVTTRVWRHDARHGLTVPSWCGPAMTAHLHSAWLATLPAAMRAAASTPFQAGIYRLASPDCGALADLFSTREAPAPQTIVRSVRRHASRKIRRA